MKKTLYVVITAIICILLCAVGLVACNHDDDVIAVEEISLNETLLTLDEGEGATLTAIITPADATDKTVTWTSSDISIASVDNGYVLGIAEGEATVTATTGNGLSAVCFVTVEAEEQYSPVQYSVTFHANGGKFAGDKDTYVAQVTDGDKLPTANATRGAKYNFVGWYRDEARTQAWNIDSDTVDDDIDVYAKWDYINDYQSVIDALADKMRSVRQDSNLTVEILSIYQDGDGYLCFVEKDNLGVFSYSSDIHGFASVKDNADLIADIPSATVTQISNYNDDYTSDSNSYVADYMAWKYSDAANPTTGIIYSCVSQWQNDNDNHYASGGPFYACNIKALMVDGDGNVFDCSFTVVAGVSDFGAVIGGTALSQDFDQTSTLLGELANDFCVEYLKDKEA